MKAFKRILLLAICIAATFAASAQTPTYKELSSTQGFERNDLNGLYPGEDVRHLNECRKSMDMGPIEDYLTHLDMPVFFINPSFVVYRQYSLNLSIDGDTLRVSGFYLNPYNTSTYAEAPLKVDTDYCLPLADYRTADGAIVLRREGNWYPHTNGELLTAQVHITTNDYYIIGGTEWEPSFDIHLVLLPKDKYVRKVMESPTRPFYFYRLASDITQYPDAYYREFIDSYNFYCSFFGDTLTDRPMNIVEIGDPQFIMCQSLRDMIIFGHYFYNVYTMMPDFSPLSHVGGAMSVGGIGYQGVHVTRTSYSDFVAFELACPADHEAWLEADPDWGGSILRCPVCSSQFNALDGTPLNGSATPCPLYEYATAFDGRMLSIY